MLYSIAILKYLRPLLLRNSIYIVTLTSNLQKVFFYSIIEFLYYNSTIELLLLLILIKDYIRALEPYYFILYRN
jgi:hypothetical protein